MGRILRYGLGLMAAGLLLLDSQALEAAQVPADTNFDLRTSDEVSAPLEMKMWMKATRHGETRIDHFFVVVPSRSETMHTMHGSKFEYWLEAEGWWSPVYPVTAGVTEDPVVMTAYPTGAVTGSIEAESERVPAELELRFEASASGDGAVPSGSVDCEVEGGSFHCAPPAGKLDLTVEEEGFRPVSFPGIELVRGASRDLGTVELVAEGAP